MKTGEHTYLFIIKKYQLFQRADVAREGEVCKSHFTKGNIVLTRNFLYIYGKKKAKSLKYSCKGILLLVKLQAKGLSI